MICTLLGCVWACQSDRPKLSSLLLNSNVSEQINQIMGKVHAPETSINKNPDNGQRLNNINEIQYCLTFFFRKPKSLRFIIA